jgi:hypothetical protein
MALRIAPMILPVFISEVGFMEVPR